MTGPIQSLRSRLRRVPLAAFVYHRLREALSLFAPARPTPYGFRLAGHSAMEQGLFEPEEIALVRDLLRDCDRLVDVGANVGVYTCLARSAGKAALAVEPLLGNARRLKANLAANGWHDTEVATVGLAEAEGESEIYGTATGASLIAGWSGVSRHTMLRQRLRLTTLDALLGDRFAGERLLIKIDIEGAEYGCFRGALRTLARTPAPIWLVEICLTEHFPQGVNPNFVATFDLLFGHGYKAVTANAARRPVKREEVVAWASAGRSDSGTHNYLFTK